MTLVISLFKAKESLLNIGMIMIVVYLRDVNTINLVKQFLYQNIEARFMNLNSRVTGWVTISTS